MLRVGLELLALPGRRRRFQQPGSPKWPQQLCRSATRRQRLRVSLASFSGQGMGWSQIRQKVWERQANSSSTPPGHVGGGRFSASRLSAAATEPCPRGSGRLSDNRGSNCTRFRSGRPVEWRPRRRDTGAETSVHGHVRAEGCDLLRETALWLPPGGARSIPSAPPRRHMQPVHLGLVQRLGLFEW